jgi:uncharacterized protein YkwD
MDNATPITETPQIIPEAATPQTSVEEQDAATQSVLEEPTQTPDTPQVKPSPQNDAPETPAAETSTTAPQADVVPTPTAERQPAVELLNAFLTANNVELVLPEVKATLQEDGNLLVDIPKTVIVKYRG